MVCLKGCQVRMLSSFEIDSHSWSSIHLCTFPLQFPCSHEVVWIILSILQQHKNIFTHVHVYGKPTTPVPLPFLLSRTQGGGGGSLWSHWDQAKRDSFNSQASFTRFPFGTLCIRTVDAYGSSQIPPEVSTFYKQMEASNLLSLSKLFMIPNI